MLLSSQVEMGLGKTNENVAQQDPCTEKEAYAGKTFDTYYIEIPPAQPPQPGKTPPPPPSATVTETYVGIILCPNQWKELDDEDKRTGPSIMRPILAPNFAVTADKNVNEYWSASGTLIHEMAHVYGRSLGQTCKRGEYSWYQVAAS